MPQPSHRSVSIAERLARRYPVLAVVPPEERRPIVRAALLHPVIIVLLLLLVGVALPAYLQVVFAFLGLQGETQPLSLISKVLIALAPPVWAITFAFSRWILPPFIKRVMRKRGYGKD